MKMKPSKLIVTPLLLLKLIIISLMCLKSVSANNSTTSAPLPPTTSQLGEPLSCHKTATPANLKSNETLAQIDTALDDLYTTKIITTGNYLDDCTYDVEFEGKTVNLLQLLERFEVLRRNYEYNLWGYCAANGATDLIAKINLLKASPGNLTICDRMKLLGCHKVYRKCTCIMESEDFRNTVADNRWNVKENRKAGGSGGRLGEEEPELTGFDPTKDEGDPEERKGGEQDHPKNISQETHPCMLVTGSDCSMHPNSPYNSCNPDGVYCLLKEGKPKVNCTLKALLNREVDDATLGQVFKTPTKFRMLDPRMPTVYCQCYKYVGAGAKSSLMGGGGGWGATLLLAVVLHAVNNL